MDNPIKTFGPNEQGRDFVIGDLHGAIPCFDRLRTHIKFNPEVDRMFSVGDLVDRGPDSQACMRLMAEPWFHNVRANHEQMMYEAFEGGWLGASWKNNGGDWARGLRNLDDDMRNFRNGNLEHKPHMSAENMEFFQLLQLVDDLPFLITINHKSGKKFHIIHAELPPGHEVTDDVLSSPGKLMALATKQVRDGDVLTWGRFKFMPFYKADLGQRAKLIRVVKNAGLHEQFNDKLGHIISGHTIVQRPVTLVGQTNIDTGAYYSCQKGGKYGYEKIPKWAGLTCVCLDDWKFYRATPEYCVDTEPFVINKSDLK